MKRNRTLLIATCCFLLAAALNIQLSSRTQRDLPAELPAFSTTATPAVNLLLGGFRGILADWLWLRVVFLQDQGRYLELVQLAEWITALQPQFPDVWILQSWNLAYNVSVLMPSPVERWRWIEHGIGILRQRAAPATGNHPRICAETAWVLMHKIGGRSDDFSDAYKFYWFDKTAPLLREGGHLPDNLEPVAQSFGLPAVFLASFDARFGPLDWRHPLTHAAAWSFLGFSLHPDQQGAVMAQRLFAQAMRSLLFHGTLSIEPSTGHMLFEPDFDRVPGMLEAYAMAQDADVRFLIPDVYRQTLERTVGFLAARDRLPQAREVFQTLQSRFPEADSVRAGFEALAASPPTYTPLRAKPHPHSP